MCSNSSFRLAAKSIREFNTSELEVTSPRGEHCHKCIESQLMLKPFQDCIAGFLFSIITFGLDKLNLRGIITCTLFGAVYLLNGAVGTRRIVLIV